MNSLVSADYGSDSSDERQCDDEIVISKQLNTQQNDNVKNLLGSDSDNDTDDGNFSSSSDDQVKER